MVPTSDGSYVADGSIFAVAGSGPAKRIGEGDAIATTATTWESECPIGRDKTVSMTSLLTAPSRRSV
jgi:hypothetical protein